MVTITDGKIKIRTCRICLDTNSVDLVLLNDDNGGLHNFEYCFGITLTTKDEPRVLCKQCADSVQNYVRFKKKCEKSHMLWQSVISDVKCSIPKHNTVENTNDNFDNCIIQNTAIIDSRFDTSPHNTLNSCNGNKSSLPIQSEHEIKLEYDEERSFIAEDQIKIENNETVDRRDFPILDMKDCPDTNDLDLDLRSSENGNSSSAIYNDGVFSCKNCNKKYKFKPCYLKHIKKCQAAKTKIDFDNEYAYECGRNYNCDINSKIKNEFNRDFEEISDSQTKGKYLCGLCRQSFTNSECLCQHLNEHWSSNCLMCGLCDFVGIDLAAIAAHRFTHYPRSEKMRFSCHICGYTKLSLLALHFHYRSKHLKKVGGYCSRCNREFTKLRMWKKHEKTHSTPKFICDFCGKTFYFKYVMKEHIMTHMRLNKSICDICGHYFARKSYLKVHIKAVHANEGPFKCSHCTKIFKNEFRLKKHLKNIKKEKSFKCKLCDKEYIMANQLQAHMVWHSQERPFCCEICGASYKANGQLTVHMRKHTGLYPYKCTQCTKAFPSSNQLKIHTSVHTGVRRHRCVVPNCERTFHSRKLLLAHLALRHKDQDGLQK